MADAQNQRVTQRQMKLTKVELIAELRELACMNDGDIEINHGRADRLLIEYINDPYIEAAYEAIDK